MLYLFETDFLSKLPISRAGIKWQFQLITSKGGALRTPLSHTIFYFTKRRKEFSCCFEVIKKDGYVSFRSSVMSETGAVNRREVGGHLGSAAALVTRGAKLSYSSHLGLSRLMDRRDTRGLAGSVTHLDRLTLNTSEQGRGSSPFITREMASNVQKLTPSCLTSPKVLSWPFIVEPLMRFAKKF